MQPILRGARAPSRAFPRPRLSRAARTWLVTTTLIAMAGCTTGAQGRHTPVERGFRLARRPSFSVPDRPLLSAPVSLDGPGRASVFERHALRWMRWPESEISRRILREYGAPIAAAIPTVARPPAVALHDSAAVASAQAMLPLDVGLLNGHAVALQTAALRALMRADSAARRAGLRLSPRGGPTASLRTYRDTREFWDARVERGLERLCAGGVLTRTRADSLRALSGEAQVRAVLALEAEGHFFGGVSFDRSILHSVAAPGTSQHLFGYAIDIEQHADPAVRALLARFGFWQTVAEDTPHFTYLGITDVAGLTARGLRPEVHRGRTYWLPDLPGS